MSTAQEDMTITNMKKTALLLERIKAGRAVLDNIPTNAELLKTAEKLERIKTGKTVLDNLLRKA